MCLITAHAKALRENKALSLKLRELEAQVASLTPPVVAPVPASETITMSRDEFLAALSKFGVIPMTIAAAPQDSTARLASKAELDRIASHLTSPYSYYKLDLLDCEDFGLAGQLKAGALEVSVRLGEGFVPDPFNPGKIIYHGFCVTLDRDLNMWLLEPNDGFPHAGKWFAPGENGYQIDKVFI